MHGERNLEGRAKQVFAYRSQARDATIACLWVAQTYDLSRRTRQANRMQAASEQSLMPMTRHASPSPLAVFAGPAGVGLQTPTFELEALPIELQCKVVDALDCEDSQARLGATSHHWQALTAPVLYPEGLGRAQIISEGRRHLLGRHAQYPENLDLTASQTWFDPDAMSPMMHAAAGGDEAMLRLVKRRTRYLKSITYARDCASLNAAQWAHLTGHKAAFTRVVGALKDSTLGPNDSDLHLAIVRGHRQLVTWWLQKRSPESSASQIDAEIEDETITAQSVLRCGHTPRTCALVHGSRNRSVISLITEQLGEPPLTTDEQEQLARGLPLTEDAWASHLAEALQLGFDPHYSSHEPGGVPSYVRYWIRETLNITPAKVIRLESLCGGVLGATPAGRELFDTCLNPNRHNRATTINTAILLLQRGAWPRTSIQASAGAIVARLRLSDALWKALTDKGACLHALDETGRSLAHDAVAADYIDDGVFNLCFLAKLGLDVQHGCHLGRNPVIELLLRSDNPDAPGRFLRAGLALHYGGIVNTINDTDVIVDSAFEAVLACHQFEKADAFLTLEPYCTRTYLRAVCTNLKHIGATRAHAWLRARVLTRLVGMQGIYSHNINPAGAWHELLSRKRVVDALQRHRASPPTSDAATLTRFFYTVRGSALNGARIARATTTSVTQVTDFVLGTQRDIEATKRCSAIVHFRGDSAHNQSSRCLSDGIVGDSLAIAGLLIIQALSLPLEPLVLLFNTSLPDHAFERMPFPQHRRIEQLVINSIDRPILWPLAQLSATVGCVPKAFISATGLSIGTIVGVIKGSRNEIVRRHGAQKTLANHM